MPLITFNSQDIIFLITSFIDLFAIIVIGVSVSLSIIPLLKTTIKSGSVTSKFSEADQESDLTVNKRRIAKNNFIKGLLLALELESANAILKLGIFTSILTGTISTFNMNNFIFFIGLLSIRIAINQSLRRFNI
jgi:hypothetical protein